MRRNTVRTGLSLLVALLCACAANTGVNADDAGSGNGRDVAITLDRTAPRDAATLLDVPAVDVPRLDVPAVDVVTARDATGDAAGCATPGTVPYAAHAMNEEFTDPATCASCPRAFTGIGSLNTPTLPPGATTLRIDGTAAGAHRCEWYVLGGSCGVTHGIASIDPDGAGTFSTTVPVFCGTNVIQVVCSNDAGRRVLVRTVEGTRCEGTGRDLRVTLSWDETSRDMELHLLRARGRLNNDSDDCTWFTCMSVSGLDWGVPGELRDNPTKDIDNTGTLGPENIYLDRAFAGTYHLVVEYWGSGEPSTSDVDVTIRERTVARMHRAMIPVHSVWYVGTVTYPEGVFTPVNTLTPCASNWMATTRGCDLPLP